MPPVEENSDAEANYFAMHLLMPTKLVTAWLEEHYPDGLDLCENAISELARAFAVSDVVAAFRLEEIAKQKREKLYWMSLAAKRAKRKRNAPVTGK